MTDVAQKPQDEKTFFGQPRVLANLFGVELWERFSFYGMQGILLLYLYYSTQDGGLGISQETAVGIVGAYGGLVYLSTIAGAWVADRLIGAERTLFYSAVLVMAGHIALSALPGILGVGVGLVLIAFGSGGVKANATSLVGTLYTADDPRRDAGFSLFYLGINLGALLGPLLTGWLQTSFGFHVGFAAAAVGMAIGLDPVHDRPEAAGRGRQRGPRPAAAQRAALVRPRHRRRGRSRRRPGASPACSRRPTSTPPSSSSRSARRWPTSPSSSAARTSRRWSGSACSRSSRCSSPARRSGRCTSSSSRC